MTEHVKKVWEKFEREVIRGTLSAGDQQLVKYAFWAGAWSSFELATSSTESCGSGSPEGAPSRAHRVHDPDAQGGDGRPLAARGVHAAEEWPRRLSSGQYPRLFRIANHRAGTEDESRGVRAAGRGGIGGNTGGVSLASGMTNAAKIRLCVAGGIAVIALQIAIGNYGQAAAQVVMWAAVWVFALRDRNPR